MNKYPRLVALFNATRWAILPSKLAEIKGFLELAASGGVSELRGMFAEAAAEAPRMSTPGGGIAVLGLRGLIAHRAEQVQDVSGPGGTSTQQFGARFEAALNDPNVSQIVIDIDSPGGGVDGVPELADQIFAARGRKKVTAVANTLAASAAYWIGSQADEFVVTPSGEVGSIGVFAEHIDLSGFLEATGRVHTLISAGKFKTEGNPFGPLEDEALSAIQGQVDEFYSMFIRAVARGRGVKVSNVRNGFGEGRTVLADLAKSEGMVDRVDTLESVISRARGPARRRRALTGLELDC